MPLVNCILCFLNHALLSSLSYLLLNFVVYVSKMPRWVEPIPSLKPYKPENFRESYSSGVLPDNFLPYNFFKRREVNGRLYIEELGVDLELCVRAHGHDVDPIMEASCNNNYFLDIISFGICELILCKRGSDHIFSLIPFLGQFNHLSSAGQYACPTSIMIYL